MKTLIIVDIQNDFLPGGALALNEGDQILSIVNELIPHYDHVIATQDFHPADHGSFADNHDEHEIGETINLHGLEQVLWPVHCVEGTPGTEFAPGLDTNAIDHIFQKGTDPNIDSYSGFHDNGHRKATGLAVHLREIGTDEVHIVGLATDYCVKFTALDAVAEGFHTTLITDACRGVNLKANDVEAATEEMRIAGVAITSSNEILKSNITLNPTHSHDIPKNHPRRKCGHRVETRRNSQNHRRPCSALRATRYHLPAARRHRPRRRVSGDRI